MTKENNGRKKFGWGVRFRYKVHEFPIWMNIMVQIMFYVLLFASSIYALVGITLCFFGVFTLDQTSSDKSLLVLVENIYLYLLPLFIIFGFYTFYYKTIRAFFDGGVESESEEYSTKVLTTSKTIFLSTVLSFTIIKAIEKLFFHEGTLDVFQTSMSLGLVIVLMAYLLIYSRIHKSKSSSDQSTS